MAALQSEPNSAGLLATWPHSAMPTCSAMAGVCGSRPGTTPRRKATGSSPMSGRTPMDQEALSNGLNNGLLPDPSEASRSGTF
eukprot:6762646-Pyramimonas_sp.AAC.1